MAYEIVEGLYVKTPLILSGAQQGQAPKITLTHEVNVPNPPAVITTQNIAVPTTQAIIFSTTLNAPVELHAILIIPSSNAATNNVQILVRYGNNVIADAANINNPVGFFIPTTIGFDAGSYPVLGQGSGISITAVATTTGSSAQVIFIGVYI